MIINASSIWQKKNNYKQMKQLLESASVSNIELIIIAIVVALLLFAILRLKFKEWNRQYKKQQRLNRGIEGEKKAAVFLKKNGFKIVEEQSEREYYIKENGKDIKISIIADFIAKKDGKQYVVEAKTGKSAPQITNSSTRRQILEYSQAFDCDGVFLLDVDNRLLKKIEFPDTTKEDDNDNRILYTIAGVFIITAIALPYIYLKIVIGIIIAIRVALFWRKR
jgi:Holliday junction resolvase